MYDYFAYMYVSMCTTCMPGYEEGIRYHETGSKDGHVGTGNWTQVLCKNSSCS